MNEREDYWFPAKTLGFGWGLPRRWQGWLVLACYALALAAAFWRVPPQAHPLAFGVCVCVATALLIAVCALKGEPPGWGWKR